MKVAVACKGNQIWPHFGHCESFRLYDTKNGVITAEQEVPAPAHRPGVLPNLLGDLGVEVILAGGMGGGAVQIFKARNIEVIVGAKGEAKAAVQAYLCGELLSTGSVCHEHAHAQSCGGHNETNAEKI